MIFSELYGAYYNAVAAVLRAAIDHPLEKGELLGNDGAQRPHLNRSPA